MINHPELRVNFLLVNFPATSFFWLLFQSNPPLTAAPEQLSLGLS